MWSVTDIDKGNKKNKERLKSKSIGGIKVIVISEISKDESFISVFHFIHLLILSTDHLRNLVCILRQISAENKTRERERERDEKREKKRERGKTEKTVSKPPTQ